jgi:apolipoprotein N-acyltransferase
MGFVARLGALAGYRRAGAAVLFGLLSAGAMPPFNLVPLLVPGFTLLLWLVDGAPSRRQAYFDGFLWGMGFFIPNLYWMAAALFTDLAQFWWVIPIALTGIPALEALYTGVATLIFRATPGNRIGRILVFAAGWVAMEWLRTHTPFGGLPWALIGYTWSDDLPILLDGLQVTSLVGIHGLGFLTVLVAAMPALAGYGGSGRRLALAICAPVVLLAGLLLWGAWRLAPGSDATVPGVTLRLLQTNIPDQVTSTTEENAARLRAVLALADSPGADQVTAQIWPEGSADFLINRSASVRSAVARRAPPGGVVLTGTVTANPEGPVDKVWNSIAAVTADGQIASVYEKAHLVPFGEYVPLQSLLSFLPIVAGRSGLDIGPGLVTLDLPGLPPVSPIVCFEAIFPHAVVDEAHRPAWIVNVSNDAWFGHSIGPLQHFAQARVRSVEEGLPLVRAANGGISGVVDAHGRRVMSLPFGITAVLDVPLPVGLAEPTPYGRFGDLMPLALILAAILLAAGLNWADRGRA